MSSYLRTFVVDNCDNDTIDIGVLHSILQYEPIDQTSTLKNTVLHLACVGSSSTMAEYLLLICPKYLLDSRNEQFETPLHWAVQNGNLDIVKLLISHGGNTFVKDEEGNTLLHWVANTSNYSVAEYLLKYQFCSFDEVNMNGDTALDIAFDNEDEIMINLFHQHCQFTNTNFYEPMCIDSINFSIPMPVS